jgi:excisionase family DNA binding protein
MPEPLMTAEEVANRFRVATKTIREWARDGRLPSIRLGGPWPDSKLLRFRADAVEAALAKWGKEETV